MNCCQQMLVSGKAVSTYGVSGAVSTRELHGRRVSTTRAADIDLVAGHVEPVQRSVVVAVFERPYDILGSADRAGDVQGYCRMHEHRYPGSIFQRTYQ